MITTMPQRSISTFKTVDINMDLDELDLQREDEKLLIDNPWTMLPFKQVSKLELPVYDLVSGDFTGEVCGKLLFYMHLYFLR